MTIKSISVFVKEDNELPTNKGLIYNVSISERFGGDSEFMMNGEKFIANDEYNNILKSNKTYRITYSPVNHIIVKLERIE